MVILRVFRRCKKNGIILKRALADPRQGGAQLLGGPLIADRFQGSGTRFCRQDALYGLATECEIIIMK
jgi:hypothetical protein